MINHITFVFSVLLFAVVSLLLGGCSSGKPKPSLFDLAPNQGVIATDPEGVVHIGASDEQQLFFLQGVAHGRDRLFQMDVLRRMASGHLAELLGESALREDVQTRRLGLSAAAERGLPMLSEQSRSALEAYVRGVNWAMQSLPLPNSYERLEISEIKPWTAVDSLSILKLVVTRLGLDIDVDNTTLYRAALKAGQVHGFNGRALFYEDLLRTQPMTQRSTVADAMDEPTAEQEYYEASHRSWGPMEATQDPAPPVSWLLEDAGALFDQQHGLADVSWLQRNEGGQSQFLGSNLWGVAAKHSATGSPMMASDPHLMLTYPAIFYQWHLVIPEQSQSPAMNVNGVGFPGLPGVVHGQNPFLTWASTNNPIDGADVFLDTLISHDPRCKASSKLCIESEGALHPVVISVERFLVNRPGSGQNNDIAVVDWPEKERIKLTVPFRSNGPILNISDPTVLQSPGRSKALTLQFVGFHGTKEWDTFYQWLRADSMADFEQALSSFAVGSQNWIYMDVEGELAYFTGADVPLRRDLQELNELGEPPFVVRDGRGAFNWIADPDRSQGQTIPYQVLPRDELPRVVNPSSGFIVNANNDPVGTTLDNNAINQARLSGDGLYYLQGHYADGLRAATIFNELQQTIGQGKKVTLLQMKRIQNSTKQFDAELMLPYLLNAYQFAQQPHAPTVIKTLLNDPQLHDAIRYLQQWDYSTPTGVSEGYDVADDAGRRRPKISQSEIRYSVAATLYNVWRAMLLGETIDATTAAYDLPEVAHRQALIALYHLLSRQPFTGVGRSGVNFFKVEQSLERTLSQPALRRDYMLLNALRLTLQRLQGDEFAAAFGGSTEISTYRWGKLHRAKIADPMQALINTDLNQLVANTIDGDKHRVSGIPRDGGYETVNASSFSARAANASDFGFGHGATRRYIATIKPPTLARVETDRKVEAFGIYPGMPDESFLSRVNHQLALWFTGNYLKVRMSTDTVDWQTWRLEYYDRSAMQ